MVALKLIKTFMLLLLCGKVTRNSYTVSGTPIDFVSGTGVDRVCK